jgi:hypothetical protein
MSRPSESLARAFVRRACIPLDEVPAEALAGEPTEPMQSAWRSYFHELGIAAPTAFLALFEFESEYLIEFGGWGVLSPEGSRYYQGLLARGTLPVDRGYAPMLPLFVCDGDLLLLDRDGAVYAYMHDGDIETAPPVAPSFEALLQALLEVLDGKRPYPLDLLERTRTARS